MKKGENSSQKKTKQKPTRKTNKGGNTKHEKTKFQRWRTEEPNSKK